MNKALKFGKYVDIDEIIETCLDLCSERRRFNLLIYLGNTSKVKNLSDCFINYINKSSSEQIWAIDKVKYTPTGVQIIFNTKSVIDIVSQQFVRVASLQGLKFDGAVIDETINKDIIKTLILQTKRKNVYFIDL